MITLHQNSPLSRLTPVTQNFDLCDRLLTALAQAESYALAGSREPFRALNYRGTTAWQEAINEVGKVLSDFNWTFNRRSQPTYSAPAGLFPLATELILFHGICAGNEVHTERGPQTRVKIEANALQLDLELDLEPVIPDGVLSLALVMDVSDNDELRVYLALGSEIQRNRILGDELVQLHDLPIALDQPALESGDSQPCPIPVVPQIADLDETG